VGSRHAASQPYSQAGMTALLDAISAGAQTSPDRESDVKRVLADGDYVVVHSQSKLMNDASKALARIPQHCFAQM